MAASRATVGVTVFCTILSSLLVTGIARCFTFGGSRNRVLHDPKILPRCDLSKEKYMKKDEQTTVNHFHEKLLKLKALMKTKVNLLKHGHDITRSSLGIFLICTHYICILSSIQFVI